MRTVLHEIEQNFGTHSILFEGGDVTVQSIHIPRTAIATTRHSEHRESRRERAASAPTTPTKRARRGAARGFSARSARTVHETGVSYSFTFGTSPFKQASARARTVIARAWSGTRYLTAS